MKNTFENKAKFFAQYWNQKVMKVDDSTYPSLNEIYQKVGELNLYDLEDGSFIGENAYLELKPLSSITDEDAIKLGFRNSDHFKFDADISYHKDELRLLGYAVEWAGLSVNEQIEYGWIKLKQ